MTPDERLADIVTALEAVGLTSLVMGGHAVRFYGLQRNTIDFDLHLAPDCWDALPALLARTPLVYFFANQVRLLELASLDHVSEKNLVTHLESWGKIRCDYLKSLSGAAQECQPPRITALSDPSDLLTWTVPPLPNVEVKNVTVKNATHWLGLIENPTPAHSNYARDKQVIQEMLKDGPD